MKKVLEVTIAVIMMAIFSLTVTAIEIVVDQEAYYRVAGTMLDNSIYFVADTNYITITDVVASPFVSSSYVDVLTFNWRNYQIIKVLLKQQERVSCGSAWFWVPNKSDGYTTSIHTKEMRERPFFQESVECLDGGPPLLAPPLTFWVRVYFKTLRVGSTKFLVLADNPILYKQELLKIIPDAYLAPSKILSSKAVFWGALKKVK